MVKKFYGRYYWLRCLLMGWVRVNVKRFYIEMVFENYIVIFVMLKNVGEFGSTAIKRRSFSG